MNKIKPFFTMFAILAYYPPGRLFPIEEENLIHTLFYNIKQKYPDFFKDFQFSTKPGYPYSEELNNQFEIMKISYILSSPSNLDPIINIKKGDTENLPFSQEQLSVLEQIAQEIYQGVCKTNIPDYLVSR